MGANALTAHALVDAIFLSLVDYLRAYFLIIPKTSAEQLSGAINCLFRDYSSACLRNFTARQAIAVCIQYGLINQESGRQHS